MSWQPPPPPPRPPPHRHGQQHQPQQQQQQQQPQYNQQNQQQQFQSRQFAPPPPGPGGGACGFAPPPPPPRPQAQQQQGQQQQPQYQQQQLQQQNPSSFAPAPPPPPTPQYPGNVVPNSSSSGFRAPPPPPGPPRMMNQHQQPPPQPYSAVQPPPPGPPRPPGPPGPPNPYNMQNMAQTLPPSTPQRQQPPYPQQQQQQQYNNNTPSKYPPTPPTGFVGGGPGTGGPGGQRRMPPPPHSPHRQGPGGMPPPPPSPAGGGGGRASSLDPSHIPQPTLPIRPLNINSFGNVTSLPVYYPKAHMKHAMASSSNAPQDDTSKPPQADTRFVVLEDGNSSPHFLRSTLNVLPQDRHTLRHTIGEDYWNTNYLDGSNYQPKSMAVLCTPLALPSMDYIISTSSNIYENNDSNNNNKLPSSGMMGLVSLEGSGTVIRCKRCNAYANAFWTAGKCNFCGTSSNIGNVASGTMEYKDLVGPFITRKDGPVKPNVVYCVDISGMMMMMINNNNYNTVMDCITVIQNDVIPNLYQHYSKQQEQSIKKIISPNVGIVFALGQEGIYVLTKNQQRIVVMSDIKEEPYCPLPLQEFTFDLCNDYESNDYQTYWNELINTFLPSLIERCVGNSNTSSCGGAAMKFLIDSLQGTGGRAVYVSNQRPNIGIGHIPDREGKLGIKAYSGSMTESWLYTPLQDALSRAKHDPGDKLASDFYKSLGNDCATNKVALDVVIIRPRNMNAFLHTATLSKVCQVSNGRFVLIEYDNDMMDDWKNRFQKELLRPLLQYSGWDAVFKVRCSSGLRIQNMVCSTGNVTQPSTSLTDDSPEVEFATVSPDTCIGVTLEHRVGGIPKNSPLAFVQTALLYTNPWTGQRRLRISTLAIPVSSSPSVVFKSIDFGCLAALWLRQAVQRVSIPDPDHAGSTLPTDDAMKVLMEQVLGILAAYRKHGGGSALGPMQFALPESLKLLPLFCMGLRKSPMFRRSLKPIGAMVSTALRPNPTADERAYHLYHGSRCTPATAMYLAHPILLDVSTATDDDKPSMPPYLEWIGGGRENGNTMEKLQHSAFVHLPPALQASISNLSDSNVYLLDTILGFYILIGRDVPQETVQSIQQAIRSPDFEENHPIGRAIYQLRLFSQVGREPRWIRPVHTPIMVVQETDPLFLSSIVKCMICDATDQEREYGDFLAHLHKNIGNRMR